MKRITLLLVLSLLFIASCNNEDFSCVEIQKDIIANNDHSVSFEAIKKLVNAQITSTRGESKEDAEVFCIEDEEHDTLLYACNNEKGGWTIYSSDTRVPAIVAESEEGTIAELKENENAWYWVQTMAKDMKLIKSLPDSKLNFSKEEIESSKKFWELIIEPDKYLKEKLKLNTRSHGELIKPEGHYELISSNTTYDKELPTPSITTTTWNQDSPYNSYCPFRTDIPSRHAPAGCTAIAVAQMLYFLHDEIGVPATAPSEAYCYGSVGSNNYNWAQTNYTTTIWDSIRVNDMYAAPFIADVGRRLNTHYGNDASSVYDYELVSRINGTFADYGISCTNSSYNSTILKNCLLDRMPVLITAYSHVTRSSGGQNVNGGHVFIVDRYTWQIATTTNHYKWVYDYKPSSVPIPDVPDYYETTTSYIFWRIGMNWGWNNYQSGWYSLTGDWKVADGTYNYIDDRQMYYDFTAIN